MPEEDSSRFSSLLLDGLDQYRRGKMVEAVRAWEAAYQLEPTNLRAREFLRSALERIHAKMAEEGSDVDAGITLDDMPALDPLVLSNEPAADAHAAFRTFDRHPWLRSPMQSAAGQPRARSAGSPPPPPEEIGAQAQPTAGSAATPPIWTLHRPPPAPRNDVSDEAELWMTAAGELLDLDDFSGALELASKVLARHPEHEPAQAMRDRCEENLLQMYESRLGHTRSRPRVVLGPDEVIWLNLDPRAGFVLAQIDGDVSFDDLYAICGLSPIDTARILSQLLEAGVIATTLS